MEHDVCFHCIEFFSYFAQVVKVKDSFLSYFFSSGFKVEYDFLCCISWFSAAC